jgi:thiamine biosynthesis lipoprotein
MAAESHATRIEAMGSEAHLIVVGAGLDLLDHHVELLDRLEQRWSRFIPDSEVSRLNRNAGRPVVVHASTLLLVERGVEAWRLSGGSFDPTVLGDVVRAGYDTSLVGSLGDPSHTERAPGASDLVRACSDIEIDHDESIVRLPPDTGFDPGGIGKGLAADLLVTAAMAHGADGVCANVGGDLRVAGRAPHGGSWTVAVEHPARAEPVAVLDLAAGAVATSTTLRRQWTVDGQRRHHLIDPRTGQPSDTDIDVMTVVAGEAWQAEVLATACLLRGGARAFDLLDAHMHGLFVSATGAVVGSAGLAPFLRPARRVA